MAILAPGQLVRHRQFGTGKVLASPVAGAVRVYFDIIASTEMVRVVDLEFVGPVQTAAPTPPPPVAPPSEKTVQQELPRLTVECLRQGLPPPGKLIDWTVGHVAARAAVAGAIKRAEGGSASVLSVRALYGQGKSHLGRLAGELALSRGFALFNAELDGKGTTLADGIGLLDALFSSVQLPPNGADDDHRIRGLGAILRRASRASGPRGLRLERFAPFLTDTRWLDSEEAIGVVEGFLCGRQSKTAAVVELNRVGVYLSPAALSLNSGRLDQRRKNQVEHLGCVVDLCTRAGARGAMIVIDEFDHDFLGPTGKLETKAEMLFALAEACLGLPVVLIFLTTTPLSFLTGLITTFAEVELDSFSDAAIESIVNRTVDAFADAYPSPVFARGRSSLFNGLLAKFRAEYERDGWGPRFVIRATIEACEVARGQQLRSLADVVL